ncbi:MAG: hypothetical protein GY856_45785, partial [bacterium]|nr:hypothetical protein [bacterium]
RLEARSARHVFRGGSPYVAAGSAIPGGQAGPVFVLGGGIPGGVTLSLAPHSDSTPRSVESIYLYAGGANDGAGNVTNIYKSVLTAPEITSYNSATLFNPLALEISQTLAVGAACSIDLSERGPLGSSAFDAMVLPGETGSELRAGGSHGGLGWYGSSDGWNRSNLDQPGSTFDSVRDPGLPGGGGGGWGTEAGGNGGGVVSILAAGAVIHLAGEIAADGGAAASTGGGGAGGTVNILAGRIEGPGRITADGGPGRYPNNTGGGGGGRIALAYQGLASDFDLAAQV